MLYRILAQGIFVLIMCSLQGGLWANSAHLLIWASIDKSVLGV